MNSPDILPISSPASTASRSASEMSATPPSSKESPLAHRKSPPPPPQDSFPDAGEAMNDFWSMSGNFIIPPSR